MISAFAQLPIAYNDKKINAAPSRWRSSMETRKHIYVIRQMVDVRSKEKVIFSNCRAKISGQKTKYIGVK